MGIKNFFIPFNKINIDYDLRDDEKYYYLHFSSGWNIFNSVRKDLIPLKEILDDDYVLFKYEEDGEYKGIPTGQSYIDADGDITDFQTVTVDNHPSRLKYKVSNNNILISSIRLARSPALLFSEPNISEYVFSNGFYIFKIKGSWNTKFILYLLRTNRLKFVLDNFIYRGIGIAAYKKEDLLKIRIPKISRTEQDLIIEKIKPIEDKIKKLKKVIVTPQSIINRVFAREFNLDLERFKELDRQKNNYLEFSLTANNIDLRNSVIFHKKSANFVASELKRITKSKVKHYISEPIVLGASIKPTDFDEHGDFYYISMATIKKNCLELDDTQLVSNKFAKENINKAIKKNDIIMTRSGVAIGKFALVEEDVQGIFADFTMRIRLKNYNHLFAYYYFRTEYFQHLIYCHKKGLQNKNIFPSQIQELPLIDIPLPQQLKIVEEIQSQLNLQEEIKFKIKAERENINSIIEKEMVGIIPDLKELT